MYLNDLKGIENEFNLFCSWKYAHFQQKQIDLCGVNQTCKYHSY